MAKTNSMGSKATRPTISPNNNIIKDSTKILHLSNTSLVHTMAGTVRSNLMDNNTRKGLNKVDTRRRVSTPASRATANLQTRGRNLCNGVTPAQACPSNKLLEQKAKEASWVHLPVVRWEPTAAIKWATASSVH